MTLEIRQHGRVGAEILGIDLSCTISDEDFAEVRNAFAEHGVVFFRDQSFTEDQHIAFARRWGPININRFFAPHPAYPEIALVVKEPDQQHNIGGGWHTDHSYDFEPALGSILAARELPPEGGATAFASMYAAYNGLSARLKERIEGRRAVHSARHVFGSKAGVYEAAQDSRSDGRIGNSAAADVLDDPVHPVVIIHPLSGKRAVYVNPSFTVRILGLAEEESQDLLAEVYEHCKRPEFQEDFHWRDGSIAFWDNRATWHYAYNDYHGHRREMHRITIEGSALV
ncbi:TauD/TfdA family dioxygenase [Novosphingobium sp. TCA1]|uniref:TauD/TfdA dioxygenase family protein n=1 Tax=Novosphingobium sp. TCA1 TaxID=2682474 RepID=UPI00130B6E66|nr:TauD/TfdA family dioxygenase [Novosphingobium sp. TCA1]GFE74815.1 alpha-ketoglutarate-dependent taurine dioxygenase [Novosphingobium sp. TCA1]